MLLLAKFCLAGFLTAAGLYFVGYGIICGLIGKRIRKTLPNGIWIHGQDAFALGWVYCAVGMFGVVAGAILFAAAWQSIG